MNSKSLELYLIAALERGQIDHQLRAQRGQDGKVTFYIHPQNGDGETPSFVVRGNALALIRAEIRAEERKAFEAEGAKAGKLSAAEELRQRDALAEQSSMQRVMEQAMEKYPFLDHKSKAANADAIEDVVARRDFYIRQGKSPSKALAMAVEKVAPRYVEKVDEPARKPGEKPAASEEQIRKNLGREKQIPQTPAGVGERGKDIDYSKLTDDEFDALPAEEKRKARGDFVKEA